MLTDFQKALLNDQIGIRYDPEINTDAFIADEALTDRSDEVSFRVLYIDKVIQEARANGAFYKIASVELDNLAKNEGITLHNVSGEKITVPWVEFKYGVLVHPQSYVMQAYTGYGSDYRKGTRNEGSKIKDAIQTVADILGINTDNLKNHPVSRGLSVLAAVRDSGGDNKDLLSGLRNIVDEYTAEELTKWGIVDGEWDLYKTVHELSQMTPSTARSSQNLNKALAYQQWLTSVVSGESDAITYIADLARRIDLTNTRIIRLLEVASGKISMNHNEYGDDPVLEGYRIISSSFRALIEKGDRTVRDGYQRMIAGLSKAERRQAEIEPTTNHSSNVSSYFSMLWKHKYAGGANFLRPNVPLGEAIARELVDTAEIAAPTAVRALVAGTSLNRRVFASMQDLIMVGWFSKILYSRSLDTYKRLATTQLTLEKSDRLEDLEYIQSIANAMHLVKTENATYGDESALNRCFASIRQISSDLNDISQFIDVAEGANVARDIVQLIQGDDGRYNHLIYSPRISDEDMEEYLSEMKRSTIAPALDKTWVYSMSPTETMTAYDYGLGPDSGLVDYIESVMEDGDIDGQD